MICHITRVEKFAEQVGIIVAIEQCIDIAWGHNWRHKVPNFRALTASKFAASEQLANFKALCTPKG